MTRKQSARKTAAQSILLAGAVTGAIVGAVALTNALLFYRTPPLETPFDEGDVRFYPTPNGDIFYQVAGEGRPLLLIHGIGAGESSFEWRRVFASLAAAGHRVYALDMVGFGKSDTPPIDYTADTYIDLIERFVRDVIGASANGLPPTDVIASSLSGAYLVAVAGRSPGLFGKIILVGPTGFEELCAPPTSTGALVRGLLRAPILGPALYNAVASRAFIRYYLQHMIYHDPAAVTEAVVTRYHIAAHQPGGDRVLPSFVTGFLNCAVADAWARITSPILLVWGANARETPPAQAQPFLRANPNARLALIADAGALPHDEQPSAFLSVVEAFLAG